MVLVPSGRARGWALRLFEKLRQDGAPPARLLRAHWIAQSPPSLRLERLEQVVFRAGPAEGAAWVETDQVAEAQQAVWSDTLIINATEHDPRSFPAELQEAVILSPIFHGDYGVEALVRPWLNGEILQLGVESRAVGASAPVVAARLATPERRLVRQVLHLAYARTMTLLLAAMKHVMSGRPFRAPEWPAPARSDPPERLPLRRWAQAKLAPAVSARLRAAFVRDDWWCVGVRRVRRAATPCDLDLSAASFSILDAGPDRFYADPFLCRHEGVTALFVEDYDYRCRRAAISVFELDAAGRWGAPQTALSRPYHLSYPHVFVHEGAVLMIPETSQNRTVELYEAVRFPHDWRLRSVLMEDIDASDTTVWFDAGSGLWWMFSAVCEFESSSHDTLSIFYSERLEGRWRAHADNPVKLEPGCTRPAGALQTSGGRLYRPTQDCSSIYGGALVWCEIKRLTPSEFDEEAVARHDPDAGYAGLHTFGRGGGFEVVDFRRRRSRWIHRERRQPA